MVTDLVQIRLQGEKKRPENERFRKYLKSHSHSDRALRHIAEEIEEQIDCTACANCCKSATVTFADRDVERLARYLHITPAKFIADYTGQSAEEGRILRRTAEKSCVFLEGNLCSVYDARPDTCRRFPHLVRGQGSIASRMWQFIDRACYCPIVFNSLEAFKDTLRYPPLRGPAK
jgi:Fe-S-cluster containining protein